ncbi:aldehyde ferredoxin oxidoreductase family protein [bacterium]|nr:aldehyde ferredoxin oxidoreductase family protein [bacterium]
MQPILRVDLSSQIIDTFEVPSEYEELYLGGASLAARLLYDVITPELEPLSDEAVLLFMNGPLTGTLGPTVGRFVVCGKSPATGLWAESNIGGFWGPELRKAGYLGLWISGKAEGPVFLSIEDEKVVIRDADNLWGLDTYEVQDAIKEMIGNKKAKVAGIGIAGENQVAFASILCDHGRVAGRTGLGAVMGAKNLKAVAVSGTGKIPVRFPDEYQEIRSISNRELRSDTLSKTLREVGTASVAEYFDYLGSLSKQYYSKGEMEGVDRISGNAMAEKDLVGVSACHGCVVACGRVIQPEGQSKKQKGPEYETVAGFGPNLLIDDLDFIYQMNEACDRFGMDTISTSGTIGLVLKLFEKGVISEKDTGGLALAWSDKQVVAELVDQIGRRNGFGDILANGARFVGEKYGVPNMVVQVKGLEVAYHDPRGVSGMALVYATSPRGACHNQSDYFFVDMGQAEEELGIEYFDRQAGAEKARNVAIHQNWRTAFNAMVMCIFGNVPPQQVLDIIRAGCGYEWTIEDLLKVGERGWTIKRVINNRLGMNRENDRLPKPLLEPLQDGGAAGYEIPFEEMLRAYYQARSWDWETGFPTKEKLASLGLEFAIEDIWRTTESE